MIFVTGDTHNDIDFQKIYSFNQTHKNLSKCDYLIITGDFGIPWGHGNKPTDDYLLRYLNEQFRATILFIDGNHENFDLLYSFPEVQMFGSTVRKLNDSVYHLKRGHLYNIENQLFWCFGGAESHDKPHRTSGISWWPEELPNITEEDYGLSVLEMVNYKVDYIITHDKPYNIPGDWHPETNSLRKYLEHIHNTTEYKLWLFGHYHIDQEFEDSGKTAICLYENIIQLGEF